MELRRTSVYEIRTEGDLALLRDMVSRCHAGEIELAGSGSDYSIDGTVFIRVRVEGDSKALEAALAACDGRSFTLVTGYGIHRRELAVVPLDSNGRRL